MQLFCVSSHVRSADARALVAALTEAAGAFPQLTGAEPWTHTSGSKKVAVAGIHHPQEMAGPRVYRARAGEVVAAFDGWPVHRSGGWNTHDAGLLLANWSELPDVAEGQFTALRVDLAADEVYFLTDSFGISPLFHVAHEGGQIVANSVEVLRLLTGRAAPSPLGVSSFTALGWATGEATLLDGVSALAGGAEYHVQPDGLTRSPYFGAATLVADARSGRHISTEDATSELVALTASAAGGGVAVDCGVTAGRDTRLLVALLLASGAPDVHWFTGGREGDIDVRGAQQVAEAAGLEHELRPVAVLDAGDQLQLANMFVSQTDGLSSLIQIGDFHDQLIAPRPLGVKVTGLGGEIGRCGVRTAPFAANVPLFTHSIRLQQELIVERARRYRQLMTPDARQLVNSEVRSFLDARLQEGWRKRELNETHYAFDRVTRWGATGVRRLAAVDDLFSPYCSRAFATYSFSLTPEERYVEAAHYRLLGALSPTLRDVPFPKPWKEQQHPSRVQLHATADFARSMLGRNGKPHPTGPAAPPFWVSWFDSQLHSHRDICLSQPESPLWAYLDREAVEQAFAAAPDQRARMREGLMRVITLFTYFDGRRPWSPPSHPR